MTSNVQQQLVEAQPGGIWSYTPRYIYIYIRMIPWFRYKNTPPKIILLNFKYQNFKMRKKKIKEEKSQIFLDFFFSCDGKNKYGNT